LGRSEDSPGPSFLNRQGVWEAMAVRAGSGMETYLYRPLALATYAANHMVSGLAPWSYHLVNVLLQAGISVMVIRIGRLWGLSVLAAGLAGLIFAVHPIHVEVVAWAQRGLGRLRIP
jgi:hypothetical protein